MHARCHQTCPHDLLINEAKDKGQMLLPVPGLVVLPSPVLVTGRLQHAGVLACSCYSVHPQDAHRRAISSWLQPFHPSVFLKRDPGQRSAPGARPPSPRARRRLLQPFQPSGTDKWEWTLIRRGTWRAASRSQSSSETVPSLPPLCGIPPLERSLIRRGTWWAASRSHSSSEAASTPSTPLWYYGTDTW